MRSKQLGKRKLELIGPNSIHFQKPLKDHLG